MKPIVIYHANCTDGFGAAFAAWLKFGDDAEYLPMNYGEVKTPADFDMKVSLAAKDNEIYILDFSFPSEVMDALFKHAKRVVWLDHHKTAFEMWCGEYHKGMQYDSGPESPDIRYDHHILLDDNRSGALIAWEYFHPGTEVPLLIKHIDDRDRWQFKLDGSKELHAALRSYEPWSFEQWKELNRQLEMLDEFNVGQHFIFKEGAAILRAHEQNVQAALKQARRCAIIPGIIDSVESYKAPWIWWDELLVKGLACNAPPSLASDLGHELANKSGTFGLVWSVDHDLRVHCSLRSNGDYDVSAIAKAFGGGGHKNAAGFSTDMKTIMEWLQ